MQERLAAVLETTGELQRSRSRLVHEVHTTLREVRRLRNRILADQVSGGDPAPSPGARLAKKYHLTPRELEVAMLLSGGASNAMIASTLRISEHTARHHTRHVLVKLRVHSRARAAALIARELGTAAPTLP
jgi:DNA-binding CsgD family transcriptional regulator